MSAQDIGPRTPGLMIEQGTRERTTKTVGSGAWWADRDANKHCALVEPGAPSAAFMAVDEATHWSERRSQWRPDDE